MANICPLGALNGIALFEDECQGRLGVSPMTHRPLELTAHMAGNHGKPASPTSTTLFPFRQSPTVLTYGKERSLEGLL